MTIAQYEVEAKNKVEARKIYNNQKDITVVAVKTLRPATPSTRGRYLLSFKRGGRSQKTLTSGTAYGRFA